MSGRLFCCKLTVSSKPEVFFQFITMHSLNFIQLLVETFLTKEAPQLPVISHFLMLQVDGRWQFEQLFVNENNYILYLREGGCLAATNSSESFSTLPK